MTDFQAELDRIRRKRLNGNGFSPDPEREAQLKAQGQFVGVRNAGYPGKVPVFGDTGKQDAEGTGSLNEAGPSKARLTAEQLQEIRDTVESMKERLGQPKTDPGIFIRQIEDVVEDIRARYMRQDIGTAGSGNWGHAGRKGIRGGSAPGGGRANRISKEGGGYTSAAKQRKENKAKKDQPAPDKVKSYTDARQNVSEKRKAWSKAESESQKVAFPIIKAKLEGKTVSEQDRQEADRLQKICDERRAEYEAALADAEKQNGITTQTERGLFANQNIEYLPAAKRDTQLSEDEIIRAVSGGDKTDGSCASVALAYAGQKQGYDVLDFRDGASRGFFSRKSGNIQALRDCGVEPIVMDKAATGETNAKKLLGQLEEGKEYYFCAGKHAAIVRVKGGKPQYLELQSPYGVGGFFGNGWQPFNANVRKTLSSRFGTKSKDAMQEAYAVDISQFSGDSFGRILGYINTDAQQQHKGESGGIR